MANDKIHAIDPKFPRLALCCDSGTVRMVKAAGAGRQIINCRRCLRIIGKQSNSTRVNF